MSTRLPNLGTHEEETARLKIAFSEVAAGRQAGNAVVAHLECVIHLVAQPDAPREFRGAVIAMLIDTIRVIRELP